MNTKRRIAERRDRNRQLAIEDAKHRCATCRRQLPVGYLLLIGASGQTFRYCDASCKAQSDEREAHA